MDEQEPKEPEYNRRCSYCGEIVEENQQCCHEVHNEVEAECPLCANEITWTHYEATNGNPEASVPKCTHCKWEGDPQ